MKIKTMHYQFIILTLLWPTCGVSTSSFAQDASTNDTPASDTPSPAATTEESTQAKRTEPNKHASLLADLSLQSIGSETEILSLKAGEDSFEAYYLDSSEAQTHGGIIFFPDDFSHPRWPIIIEPLRTGLSEFGWSTLTIPLPAPIVLANPIRTTPSLKSIKTTPSDEATTTETADATAATADTKTDAAIEPQEKEPEKEPDTYKDIIQRGITAMQALQQKDINRFVIAGVGTGATWATAFALNLQAQTDINLLLINARQSTDLSAPSILTMLANLKVTTLDLYTTNPRNSSRSNKNDATLRNKTARRNNLTHYHQSRLPATSSTPQGQEWLIRYTRGLLETYIVKAKKETTLPPSTPPPSVNQSPGAAAEPRPQPQTKQADAI